MTETKRARKRAFSYIRFSTPEQLKGDSLRRQLEWGKNTCERKGWGLDESVKWEDRGKSGFHGENVASGALGAFLKAIHEKKVLPGDILLIESIDRLTREALDDAYQLFRSILKAGVDIYTREPERHYTKESLNNLGDILQALVYMERAFNESNTKSMRGREWWEELRKGLGERKPVHQVPPAWLALSPSKDKFIMVPEAVTTVQRIYKWAGEGMGINPILKKLQDEKVKPFGRSGQWCRSYVAKLLNDRSVMGEYQPHVMKGSKRVPFGDPVPNYFPLVVSETEWHRVRRGVKGRAKERGRKGREVANLFTGLVRDARDSEKIHLEYAGSARANHSLTMVSYGVRNHKPGAVHKPFPYRPVEEAFLYFIRDVEAAYLTGEQGDTAEQIAEQSGKLEALNHKLELVEKQFIEEADSEALLKLMSRLEAEKKVTAARLDELKSAASTDVNAALGESRVLIELLEKAGGAERESLRTKIKARIKQLVKEMWFIAWDVADYERNAELQVVFQNGKVHSLKFEWFRKGRERGRVNVLEYNEITGSDVIRGECRLSEYRDAKHGGWHDRTAVQGKGR